MKKLLMVVLTSVAALVTQANPEGYIMLAVHSPGELPSPAYDIYGVRLSLIYGDCQNIDGFDLGFAGRVREHVNGTQIGFGYNLVDVDMYGAQYGTVNWVNGDVYGSQWGFMNYAGILEGWQWGVVNMAGEVYGVQGGRWSFNWCDYFDGLQYGIWNGASEGYGAQIGFVNTAGYLAGCQIGVFNWANDLDGVQIGFSNVVRDQAYPWFPILNFGW